MPPHPQRYKPDDKFNWLVMIVIVLAFGLNNIGVISWQAVKFALAVTLIPMIFYLAFLGRRAYQDGQTRSVVINVVLALLFMGALYVGIFTY